MERHESLIDKEANALSITQIQAIRSDILEWREGNEKKLAMFEEEQTLSQYQSIVAWLKANDADQMAIHDALKAEAGKYPGTCSWILKNQKVKSWLQRRPEPSILWLQGSPGSGKTMISSQLVDFLKAGTSFVIYHFCTYICLRILDNLRADSQVSHSAVCPKNRRSHCTCLWTIHLRQKTPHFGCFGTADSCPGGWGVN